MVVFKNARGHAKITSIVRVTAVKVKHMKRTNVNGPIGASGPTVRNRVKVDRSSENVPATLMTAVQEMELKSNFATRTAAPV